ncbi:hypothetical protein GCK72_007445 [Caenorhabditis remanei]|uniref:BTB domain-containing protein n=1 Tax=Caenorhabditis remanei TaxID=31234 RepID=A0A6A5HLC9_CAERE|nr:hypothetical protein GCK72_007445 [Caenorhabditis remanei]KAF1767486.1 hypothetical protein GCK72_007445 [Caenorhabditis remanei]
MSTKEFVLKHTFKNINRAVESIREHSEVEEHFNIPWRMNVSREKNNLAFYLCCTKEIAGDTWSIDTEIELELWSPSGKSRSSRGEMCFGNKKYAEGYSQFGWSAFINWKEMERDFVKNGSITVEGRVRITGTSGLYTPNLRCFDKTMEEVSDVVLDVNDRKFYVSKLVLARHTSYNRALPKPKKIVCEIERLKEKDKFLKGISVERSCKNCAKLILIDFFQFLATHSPYFKSLFLGNFRESNYPEVPLDDIDADDFQKFLEVLYGDSPINDSCVEGIVLLADMYQTEIVIKKCESFILKKSTKTLKKKLQMAIRYNLENLKTDCLNKIKSFADVRSVLPSDIIDMDHSILAALMEKVLSTAFSSFR